MTIGSSSVVESVEAPEARTEPARLTAEEAAALARGAGLEELGVRPGFVGYAREVWGYRHLVWHLSSAQAWATNQNNYLGQLWAVLNPLLLVGSYYLIFGLLLKTRGGTSNYIAFLTIGIFVFGYSASAIIAGSRAVVGQIGLVRALRFPRAVLPISVTLTQFLVNVPAFAVLMVMIPLTGEPFSPHWLLFPVALVFQSLINLGLAFYLARVVNTARDSANLVPVGVRLARYVSGVFFSIPHYAGYGLVSALLLYQPLAVSMTTAREALMDQYPLTWGSWVAAAAWGVGLSITGIVFFWRGEGRYGSN
ncbi:ABC transporter permease [Terrabacter sp. Root181]|uniref:ABC transporter permease n=1 Tax=Terrabacter sp. Root181 TaxID=1736484 RepID=UPI0006FA9D00|nr:ABC transporter permease [Terrabacter sp. Root181]KRB47275.1 phosphate ABC transporter permease [Terrabacter sp. Root181]